METRLVRWIAVFALVLVACSTPHYETTIARFVIRDSQMNPPGLEIGHGLINIIVWNLGVKTHELVLVHQPASGGLPLKPDGSVDESQLDVVYDSGPIPGPGTVKLPIDVPAGTYLGFSNIDGDFAHRLFTVFKVL